jgi:hypothetical protein
MTCINCYFPVRQDLSVEGIRLLRARDWPAAVASKIQAGASFENLAPAGTRLLRDAGSDYAVTTALILFYRVGAELEVHVDDAVFVEAQPAQRLAKQRRQIRRVVPEELQPGKIGIENQRKSTRIVKTAFALLYRKPADPRGTAR